MDNKEERRGSILIIGIGARPSVFDEQIEDFVNAVDNAKRNNMPFVEFSRISGVVHNDIFYEAVACRLQKCVECRTEACYEYEKREVLIKALNDFKLCNFRSSLFVEWLTNQLAIIDYYKGNGKEGFDLEKALSHRNTPEGWIDEDEDEGEQ